MAPRTDSDVASSSFAELCRELAFEADLDAAAKTAFPAEVSQETEDFIDEADSDADEAVPKEVEEILNKEEEMLEEIPLPGVPGDEAKRRKAWLCLLYTSPSPRDLSTSRMPSSA